jgi:hypothetical protein
MVINQVNTEEITIKLMVHVHVPIVVKQMSVNYLRND